MLKVLSCVVLDHDQRLVGLSALICVLGCFTTVSMMARATAPGPVRLARWPLLAAIVFGSSVWSLHFVAMLAFEPATQITYDVGLTALSAVVAVSGAFAAMLAWLMSWTKWVRVMFGGCLLGLSVTFMHYIGVDAMKVSSLISYDAQYVAASVVVSIAFSIVAFARSGNLDRTSRRLEISGWLCLAICGLHFTGMAALTMSPIAPLEGDGGVLGTATLAVTVGGVSLAILIASLAATIFDQHMSQRALQELGRMRLMSNLAQEVLLIHRDGVVLEINEAGERLLRAKVDEIIGRPLASFFCEASVAALARRELCIPSKRHPEELEVQAVDGTKAPVEISCQPVEFMGKPATVVALRDLTDRKRDEERIRHLARYDVLTNLPNRYTLLERLDYALDMAAQQKSALAIVYIDLDRFKPVNDLYGHAIGDALLTQVSKRIHAETQVVDTLARIGGDEFVMILASGAQPERASNVATAVIEAVRKPFMIEGHRVEIGASIGIALYPDDGATADTLMRAADAAMYRAKEEGRGALRFFESSMNDQLQARLQLQLELAVALEQGELVLHYQPIVNAINGELDTFEALVRWNHPRRGMVPPLDFIPIAEQTGLIDQIGKWVIETACREAASWPRPWRIAVNVSPRQFRQSSLCDNIATALQTHGLNPARLSIEVTESVLVEDTVKTVAVLNRLRDMGVRIALDDFGTGYSSLSYLQLFKFDKLKVDKSFVKKLGESDQAVTLTRTIINLGHNLGLSVTAEGVETMGQLALLRQLGCDEIQGYLVARPAPAGTLTERDRLQIAGLFTTKDLLVPA